MAFYIVTINEDDHGVWFRFPAFPNLFATGATRKEAGENALKALLAHIQVLIENLVAIPLPQDSREDCQEALYLPSIVVLRIGLHNAGLAE